MTRVEGVAMLRDTRLAVRLIAQQYRAGDSVDDILHTYPHLSAAAVHDAISYTSITALKSSKKSPPIGWNTFWPVGCRP